jgi:S-DNA-T family DNA segregation ATPase FtsK/SpoIIIE
MASKSKERTTKVTRGRPKNKLPLSERYRNIVQDERYRVFTGLALILFSILLTVSFVSFLFTWKQDQDILDLPWFEYIFDTNVRIENSVGKVGLFFSQLFIYNWFGIASFGFILIFVVTGLHLLNIKFLSLSKVSKYTLFLIFWFSVFLSFIVSEEFIFVGGNFGFRISDWLISLLGNFVTALFLIIVIVSFLIFTIEGLITKTKLFVKIFGKSGKVFSVFSDVKQQYNEQKAANVSANANVQSTSTQNVNANFPNPFLDDSDKDANATNQNPVNQNIVIDLDTNEPLQITQKRNYKLTDSGDEIDDDFEIEDKTSQTEQNIQFKPIADKKENDENTEELEDTGDDKYDEDGNLILDVEQNDDVRLDDITREPLKNYDPTLDLSNFVMPSLDLLAEHQSGQPKVTKEELLRNKNKIVETLKHYNIEINKIKATIGPTITLYEIIPAPGVRISKIKNLEDDIALSLSAIGIRIIAPMPGRGTIGIEVPNEKPEIVSMQSVIRSAKFQESEMELPIALGKTISNETYVFDLTKMPHLLVAGATGQGKSVGLNAMITSILFKKHPAQVKFVLIDPKKVELTLYERLEKHYLATLPDAVEPIITDNKKVVQTVSSLNVEMDNRYQLLKKAKARNIKEYNEKFIGRRLNPNNGHRYMPYIILVIDEFADLIMTAGKEIEMPITRLAQLARAVGLHLIVATQRPSTNIITGVIKANFPARIAFKVASMIDSRTILDSPGANHLVGRGDMLISEGSDLVRLQCAFIDTPELDSITQFIEHQQGYATPFLLPEVLEEDAEALGSIDMSKKDEFFEDAARIVVANQQGSTSLIQRKMSIGYNRAGRIIDQLEAAGIVGPSKGSKARDVYFMDEYSLEQHLITLL